MAISLFEKQIPYRPKNVKIENYDTLPGNSAQELHDASDVIGNYAKKHKANVRFYDIHKDYYENCEFDCASVDRALSDSVGIEVTQKGKQPKGTWVKYAAEDDTPFLRRVYQSLQRLIEGKESRIAEEGANTIEKLIKAGKIKA